MASLLDPLTTEQKQLLAVVYEPFGREGCWPYFQYVEMKLDQAGLGEAASLLASFPTWGPAGYGAVWYNRTSPPEKNTTVGLTVAGLFQVHGTTIQVGDIARTVDTSDVQRLFITTLGYLVQRQGAVTPQPFVVQDVTVTSTELKRDLEAQVVITDATLQQLYELLYYEPRLVVRSGGDNMWSVEPRRDIRRFKGVTSVQAYLERLDAEYAVPTPPLTPVQPSPFSLPAAIDYLNAIWESRVGGGPLFRFANGLTATKLVEPCVTPEEFQACLSALSDVLKYRIGKQKAPFQRLKAFRDRLNAGSRERIAGAIRILETINDARVGGQHGDASRR